MAETEEETTRASSSMLSSAFEGIMHLFRAPIVFDNFEDMYMYKKVVLVKSLDSET